MQSITPTLIAAELGPELLNKRLQNLDVVFDSRQDPPVSCATPLQQSTFVWLVAWTEQPGTGKASDLVLLTDQATLLRFCDLRVHARPPVHHPYMMSFSLIAYMARVTGVMQSFQDGVIELRSVWRNKRNTSVVQAMIYLRQCSVTYRLDQGCCEPGVL